MILIKNIRKEIDSLYLIPVQLNKLAGVLSNIENDLSNT